MVVIKSIVETVPEELSGGFGAMTNVMLNNGAFVCSLLGMALPDEKEYKTDTLWRLSFGFPILLAVIQIILMLTPFSFEPLDYCLSHQ